jgi:YbbR domain-containing protein
VRPRKETIGTLGRSSARVSRPAFPPQSPDPPPEPTRGALRRWLHGALFDNLGLKFLSMVLAVTVFLLVNTDRNAEMTTRLKVTYMFADDKVLISERLDEVYVTLRGPQRRLEQAKDGLQPVNLDLRKAATGDIALNADQIKGVPVGYSVVSVSPRTVHLTFSKRIEKVVEITPVTSGLPQHGYVVRDVKASPATVKISGAESTVAALTALKTDQVSLYSATEDFAQPDVQLVLPPGVDVEGRSAVSVQVTLARELVTRTMSGLAIEIRGDGGVDATKWKISKPEKPEVDVTVTGQLLLIEKGKMTPVVHVGPGDTKAHEVEVTIPGLDSNVGRKISPERVTVTPVAPPKAPPPPAP